MKRKYMACFSFLFIVCIIAGLLWAKVGDKGHPLVENTLKPYTVDFEDHIAIRCLEDGSIEATVDAYEQAEWNAFQTDGYLWYEQFTNEEYKTLMESYDSFSSFQNMRAASDYVDVSAGCYGTLGAVHADGTVAFNKRAEKRFDVLADDEKWRDITDLALGAYTIVGLKDDGSVIMHGKDHYHTVGTHPSEWKDVVAIEHEIIAVGLRSDGTVYYSTAEIDSLDPDNFVDLDVISEWTDIVQVDTSWFSVVGLKADGTVVFAGDDRSAMSGWTDITKVAAGMEHAVGLKKNGTLVSTQNWALEGTNSPGYRAKLRGIIDIYANRN